MYNKLFLEIEAFSNSRFSTLCELHNLDQQEFKIIADIGINYTPWEVWQEIKNYNEIYVDSGLLPNWLSSIQSDKLFDDFLKLGIKEGIRGKKVYFFRKLSGLHLSNIDKESFIKFFNDIQLMPEYRNKFYHLGCDGISFKEISFTEGEMADL